MENIIENIWKNSKSIVKFAIMFFMMQLPSEFCWEFMPFYASFTDLIRGVSMDIVYLIWEKLMMEILYN